MLEYKTSIEDFEELKSLLGCCDYTLNKIEEFGVENEFMRLLEAVFYDNIPDLTSINDFIRFEDNFILEYLGIL